MEALLYGGAFFMARNPRLTDELLSHCMAVVQKTSPRTAVSSITSQVSLAESVGTSTKRSVSDLAMLAAKNRQDLARKTILTKTLIVLCPDISKISVRWNKGAGV